MADNVAITAGSGTAIAADDISSVFYQRVKIGIGADGSATDWSDAAPAPVKCVAATVTATLTRHANTTGYVDLGNWSERKHLQRLLQERGFKLRRAAE